MMDYYTVKITVSLLWQDLGIKKPPRFASRGLFVNYLNTTSKITNERTSLF
jgi:hypothetical protein